MACHVFKLPMVISEGSVNGKPPDSDSGYEGSIPSPSAIGNFILKRITDKHLGQFVKHVKAVAKRHGVEVHLISKRAITTNEGLLVNGYFQSESTPGELVVAVGRPEKEWALALAHEYCHMQQWIQQSKMWLSTLSKQGIDYASVIDTWLSGLCELSEKQKTKVFNTTINMELECEQMAVQLIKKHPAFAGTSVSEYIQKSNAYLNFYHHVARSRQWYTAGRAPYQIPEIWQKMPTKFQKDYTTFPYARLYKSVYK